MASDFDCNLLKQNLSGSFARMTVEDLYPYICSDQRKRITERWVNPFSTPLHECLVLIALSVFGVINVYTSVFPYTTLVMWKVTGFAYFCPMILLDYGCWACAWSIWVSRVFRFNFIWQLLCIFIQLMCAPMDLKLSFFFYFDCNSSSYYLVWIYCIFSMNLLFWHCD